MLKRIVKIFSLILIIACYCKANAQSNSSAAVKWTTWALLQAVPSPSFFDDRNENDARLRFGFRWDVTPVNYSFNANELVSPVQMFFVNPVRRYGGSVELFVQPEWMTGSYHYSDLSRFHFNTGVRGFLPLAERGERLALSAGALYKIRKNKSDNYNDTYAVELGVYTFFGMLGLKFDYYLKGQNKFDFSINIKYF
ncbi:MAG: hypothetical protein L0Y76_02125 [Ignavibacteria bacterium]|nr:hypothetical protein [Ignavibacteria bacterium]